MTKTKIDFQKPSVQWITMIALSLIWGSSFILIKKSIEVYTPMQVGALRITISSLCFLPIFLSKLKKIDWKNGFYFAVVAVCGSGIPAFLYPMAQQHINSGVAGILNGLTPLFTLILGIVVFGKAFKVGYLWGILLGLSGVIFLSVSDLSLNGMASVYFYLLIIMATICYATSVNTVDSFLKKIDPVTVSAVSFVMLGPFGLAYLASTDVIERMTNAPDGWSAFGAIFLLAFFGTFLSIMIFFILVQKTNALFGSLVAYLIPVVALGWGFVAGETIGLIEITGLCLILIGVYLTKKVS